jgi:hypothetical protein
MILPTASWAGCQPARVKSGLPIKWQSWLAPSNFFWGSPRKGLPKNFGGGGQIFFEGSPPLYYPYAHVWCNIVILPRFFLIAMEDSILHFVARTILVDCICHDDKAVKSVSNYRDNQTFVTAQKLGFFSSYLSHRYSKSFLNKKLVCCSSARQMCCSSARQSQAFDEGIVAWRVISKQILLRV